jgi:hypothetical protein
MKRIFTILLAAVLCGLPAAAQSICFWTDDADVVPVRIYIDREYLGDVTGAYSSQPTLDAPGCLSVDTTPDRHEVTAVDKYGRVYKGWPKWIRPREREVNYMKMNSRYFRVVDQARYTYVFTDWIPLYYYTDIPFHGHVDIEDLDPLTDNGLLVGMGVAAIGATAAMTVAAARNWNLPDSRFPYTAIGFGTEILPVTKQWRNVAQFRARFGNLGGVSLLADAGVATTIDPYYRDYGHYGNRLYDRSYFTWSVGAGLDYGGFCFAIRYKPAVGDTSPDTFLNARCSYDFRLSRVASLNLHGGFGVAGYGAEGLFDYYEFPFGISLLFKL